MSEASTPAPADTPPTDTLTRMMQFGIIVGDWHRQARLEFIEAILTQQNHLRQTMAASADLNHAANLARQFADLNDLRRLVDDLDEDA